MSKIIHDSVMDAALDKISTSTLLSFCSAGPADYAGIAAVTLASVAVTSGDFTKANGDTSGRKLTVGQKTGIVPTKNGDVIQAVLSDGVTMLASVTITTKTVATTETWSSPAFDVWEIADPTP